MTYKIRYSPKALKDMDNIWDDVLEASKDFDIADKYLDDLVDGISKKREAPKTGIPLFYRDLFTGFYYIHFKAYNAFYRIKDDYIEVSRILLSKMEYMKELLGEEE